MGRDLIWAYGVYVVIKQTGHIRTFSMVNTLVTLTSALTLLALSNVLTDFLALHIMPRKQLYKELMIQESDHMGGITPRPEDEDEEAGKPSSTSEVMTDSAGTK